MDDFLINTDAMRNQPKVPKENQLKKSSRNSLDHLPQPAPAPMDEEPDQHVSDKDKTGDDLSDPSVNSLEILQQTTIAVTDTIVNSPVCDQKVSENLSENLNTTVSSESSVQRSLNFIDKDVDPEDKAIPKVVDIKSVETPVDSSCAIEDVNSLEHSAVETSSMEDIGRNSVEDHALGSTLTGDIGMKSIENHALEPAVIRDIGVTSIENHVESSAIGDAGVNSVDTNPLQIVSRTGGLNSTVADNDSVKPVCEDGELCVCEVKVGVKPKKRKCGKKKVTKRKTKIPRSGKGKSKRLKFSLPDFDSFVDDSVSGAPSDENNIKNDLNNTDTVFLAGSVSFDMNLDKDECQDAESDDDDLPVGLTPIKIEKFFQEKDIVWVKWKGWPYLPAMVKRVYKKKKRMTCLVFTPEDKPEKPWSVSTAGGKVWSYFDNGKKEEILKASETLEPSKKAYFKECMARLEMYLTRKALGQIKDDYAYFNQDDFSDGELMESEGNAKSPDAPNDKLESPDDREDEEEEGTNTGPVDDKLSKKGEMRKEKLRQKTQKFTDFLLSTTCKEYLQSLYLEKIESERHKIFLTGSVKQKARLKHQGYGPIDDETQIMSLLTTFASWLKEVNNNPCLNDNAYIMDVWAPEAIVFAYQNYYKYNKKRAWEMFYKGVRRTKEELKSEHVALMKQIQNMTPEEKRCMEERHEEMLRAAGIEPMRLDFNLKNLR